MSTRDEARLTAQERAALSSLEALATADDPQLAARLRGPNRWNLSVLRAREVFAGWVRASEWLQSLWVAVPLLIVGLVLVVVGLSVGWEVGVAGALLSAAGLRSVVREAARRVSSRPGA